MADGYPDDQARTTRALQRDVAQAQGSAGSRQPLTKASKGWALGAMGSPDLDELGPNDVHIYASGGQLRVASQSGDIALGDIPFGSSVSDPPSQTATPLGSGVTVLGADYNKMGADVDAIWDALVELLAVLRSGRFPS